MVEEELEEIELILSNPSSTSNHDVDTQMQDKPKRSPMRNAMASAFGAVLTSIIATPFDVLKTRQQSLGSGGTGLREAAGLARTIVQREGVRALYRGWGATLVLTVPASSLYFTLYEASKQQCQLAGVSEWAVAPLSGLAARVTTSFFVLPVEVVRTNVQAHSASEQSAGSLRLFVRLLAAGHWRRLWAGWIPTTMRDVPFSVLYWTSFEEIRRQLLARSQTAQSHAWLPNFVSGALGGSIAALTTLPFDALKTRRQMAVHLPASVAKPSTWALTMSIYAEGGLSAFFRGWIPRVAKVAPSCAVMITTYEALRK